MQTAIDSVDLGVLAMLNPSWAAKRAEQQRQHEIRQFNSMMDRGLAKPWDDFKTKFERVLLIDAATFTPVRLFDTKPMTGLPNTRMKAIERKESILVSPCQRFFYANHTCPKTHPLSTAQGNKRGNVYFTDKVVTPTLCEFTTDSRPQVWMGITPMEMFTQRKGIQLAAGRVVIGGLGLGWFLNRVCLKPSVTEVIVVEREASLVSWLRPVLEMKFPAIRAQNVHWHVGNVYEFMAVDVPMHGEFTKYLLDIWPCYNGYDHKFSLWKKQLGNRLWGWGMTS